LCDGLQSVHDLSKLSQIMVFSPLWRQEDLDITYRLRHKFHRTWSLYSLGLENVLPRYYRYEISEHYNWV
jgi:hypothetical protein